MHPADPHFRTVHTTQYDLCAFQSAGIPVGIATRFGLDGPGVESRWGARFSAPSLLYNGVPFLFTGDATAGTWR